MMWTQPPPPMWMNANGAAAALKTDESARTWHFNKTKMCKFHIIGACSKGTACPFAHNRVEMQPLPDLTCTKLCKELIDTGVCSNKNCTYAHNKVQLRTTSTYHRTKLCRFSQMGHCALGSKCNFAHNADELRPVDATVDNGEDQSAQANFCSTAIAQDFSALPQTPYFPSPMFWPDMGVPTLEFVNVEDPGTEMFCPPGLEAYQTSSPLRSLSPVRISLGSDDVDGPLYVTQTSFKPTKGQGLLRSVRSAGSRLSHLGSDEPAFIAPLRPSRSAGSRLAELGDSRRPQKDALVGLGHYFEGDNSSTPSCLSPRGSAHSTEGDDLCQAESPLLPSDMQRKMAESLLSALRDQAA